jgi:zinc protease
MIRGPSLEVIERDIPQSIVQFGGPGLKRSDPDYMAAYVMNDMLGGSSFGARLTDEIRERRGLTYSIGTDLLPFEHGSMFVGSAATRNERVGETIELIRHELARFAGSGPTQEELDDAKTYVIGSYVLRFDTSERIADLLVGMQEQRLGIDYVVRRESLIGALTIADIRRVAKRLIDSERLIVTVVGKPAGLSP